MIKLINKLKSILGSKQLQLQIIKEELLAIKEKFGDPRRTEIVMKQTEFKIEDMIAEEEVVITISHGGYIKRFPVSGYRRQSRGGKGVTGAASREDDFVEHMFIASTHNYILFFTDKGKCYWLKVFEVPEGGRTSKGKAITNLIAKEAEENITAFLGVKEFTENQYVFMVTEEGQMKKTSLMEFSNPRKNGIGAISLDKHDLLRDVKLTDGTHELVIGTHEGIAIRFPESEVRAMGRSASGVRAIKLSNGDKVIGAVSLKRTKTTILVATEHGFGKRSDLGDYRVSHRGGKGIATLKANEKTGKMIAIKEVQNTDDIVVVSSSGMIIRQRAEDIRVSGRNTSGVRLIRLGDKDAVTAIAIVTSEDEEEKQLEAADKTRNGSSVVKETGGETSEQNDLFGGKKKALKTPKNDSPGKEKLIGMKQKKSVPKKEEKAPQQKKPVKPTAPAKAKPAPKQKAKQQPKKKGKK
ncbi:MAG: DNA gyrase C-terminal beta-propeller domain-containing protein [Bacteroidota bacterium]